MLSYHEFISFSIFSCAQTALYPQDMLLRKSVFFISYLCSKYIEWTIASTFITISLLYKRTIYILYWTHAHKRERGHWQWLIEIIWLWDWCASDLATRVVTWPLRMWNPCFDHMRAKFTRLGTTHCHCVLFDLLLTTGLALMRRPSNNIYFWHV